MGGGSFESCAVQGDGMVIAAVEGGLGMLRRALLFG